MMPGRSVDSKNSVKPWIADSWRSSNPSLLWNTAMAGIPSSVGYFSRSISKARTDSTPTGKNSCCSFVVTSDKAGETRARMMMTPTQTKIVTMAERTDRYG